MWARGQHRRSNALTLIELVVSVAITSILVGGLVSAVVLATRALPEDIGGRDTVTMAGALVDQMADELSTAQHVYEATATAIKFSVPDRDNDGVDEVLRYTWSGTAGDALQREYNGSAASDVVLDVHEFSLMYESAGVVVEVPGDPNTLENEPLVRVSASRDLFALPVNTDAWWGQSFQPTLPAGAIGWTVSQALVMARQTGSPDGVLRVEVRAVDDAGVPVGDALDRVTVSEARLEADMSPVFVSFPSSPEFKTGTGAAIVISATGGDDEGEVQAVQGVTAPGGGLVHWDGDWSADYSNGLILIVIGDVLMSGDAEEVKKRYLTSVEIELISGPDDSGRIETRVTPLNVPEVGS